VKTPLAKPPWPTALAYRVAAVRVGNDQRVLSDRRHLEDGRILAQSYLETSRVLQQLGKVECLIAVTVVLPLATGKKVNLHTAG
jgi:hypothetical protein